MVSECVRMCVYKAGFGGVMAVAGGRELGGRREGRRGESESLEMPSC